MDGTDKKIKKKMCSFEGKQKQFETNKMGILCDGFNIDI
jgi:hypothetical protein